MKNQGFATVEACFVVPLFLFFVLTIADFGKLYMAEAHIYQSLAETAIYVSEYSYLEDSLLHDSTTESIVNQVFIKKKFKEYMGEDARVEQVIENGLDGITIVCQRDSDNDKIYYIKALFTGNIDIPFLGTYKLPLQQAIKQKGFVGYTYGENGDDVYVFVTPNDSVYHTTRDCTHLKLTVNQYSYEKREEYEPCHFCGKNPNGATKIYVAITSNVYHLDPNCSGLKRTVIRMNKKEVSGLNPCQRCGR